MNWQIILSPVVVEDVGSHDEGQVEWGVFDPGGHVLPLDLLEVELWEDVEPVGDLDDVEELEHEGHVGVGVSLPQAPQADQVLADHDVAGPHQAHQVEGQQLPGLVELGVLNLKNEPHFE